MMPDPRYRRMQELFEEARELKPAAREPFLAGRCGDDPGMKSEVEALLAHEAPAAAALDSMPPRTAARGLDEGDPVQVGPYTILGVLGEGGFGVVYRAERRSPMVQQVALKIIKPGMDSKAVVRRFDQERQALAMMDHPNVARVFDAGVTGPDQGSRPYFVMEHVQGEAITLYCDRHRLTVRQRLELFIPVCEAVQHAHMKGIIHRDLKPSNILVTVGNGIPIPKVIDFGVAKAVAHTVTAHTVFTEQGQVIGTPEYMSPEQAQMGAQDIDTRTDVYSLGVVLYELLTGALPFSGHALWSKGFAEVQRIIREVDPPRPSTRLTSLATPAERESGAAIAEARRTRLEELSRELRRELEWIPLRAMRKDRADRYRSAIELADDVRNYMAGKALIAGPESTVYRFRKFVRRRRGPVIAGAAVAASLLAGIAVATLFAIGQARARISETAQHNRAEAIGSFLKELLTAADPYRTKGDKVTVRDALDTAAKRIDDGELRGQSLVEAEIRVTIGVTYTNLGLYFPAAGQLRAADAIQTRELGPRHATTLQTRVRLSEALYYTLEDYPGTVALAEPTAAAVRETFGSEHEETLRAMVTLGTVLGEVGREAEGERMLLEAIEGHKRRFGPEDAATADAMDALGTYYAAHAQPHKAEPLHREALRIHDKALDKDDPRTLRSVQYLADADFNLNNIDEAFAFYRQAHEGRLRVLGPDHLDTLGSRSGIGNALNRLGRRTEGTAVQQECLDAFLRIVGPKSLYTINQQRFMAAGLESMGRLEDAENMYRAAPSAALEAYGPNHYDTTVRLQCQLGRLLERVGKDADAEELCRKAFEQLRRQVPRPYGGELLLVTIPLRDILRRQERTEEALEIGREMLRFLLGAAGAPNAAPVDLNRAARQLLIITEHELRDHAKAYEYATLAVERSGHGDPDYLDTLAFACRRLGRFAEEEATLEKSLSIIYRSEKRQSIAQAVRMANLLRANLRAQKKTEALSRASHDLVEFLGRDWPQASADDLNSAAWTLLTLEEAEFQDPHTALALATRAVEKSGGTEPNSLDSLALAYHRTGDHAKAIETQVRALSLLPPNSPDRAEFEARLSEFQRAVQNAGPSK